MKLCCDRKALQEALQAVSRAAGRGEGEPLQRCMRVRAEAGSARLEASDGEMTIGCRVPAEVAETGEAALPSRLVLEIVSRFPAGGVSIQVEEKEARITCGRAEYRLPVLPADDLLPLPAVGEETARFPAPAGMLRRMIRQVLPAAATDETRPVLAGVSLTLTAGAEGATRLTLVATDTYRLAAAEGPISVGRREDADLTAIVPRRVMGELARLLAEEEALIAVTVDGSQVEFRAAAWRLLARQIAGRYSKWEQLLPIGVSARLLLPTAGCAAAVRRAAIVARGDSQRILLRTESDTLLLLASASDGGRAREEVRVEQRSGELEVALNARYLLEILEAIPTEHVCLEVGDPRRPLLFRPDGDGTFRALLAPMATA
jgi:DNA polymerase-3 subunit beta